NATYLRCPDVGLSVVVLGNQTSAPSRAMALRIASFFASDLSYEGVQAIEDTDPKATELVRKVLADAQRGQVDTTLFAQDAQQTAGMIRRVGPQFLGPKGELKAIELLERREGTKTVDRVYRTVFGGTTLVWSVSLDRDGKIVELKPIEQ